jgi:hypothetical protein
VGDEVVVTGQAMYTGSVFAFGGVASTDVDITGDGPIPVGNALRISATLEFPDVARDPPLMGAIEPVFDEALVDIGDAVGPDGRNVSQDFVCTGAGSAIVGFLYSVVNVGADSPLFDQLGLRPASTRVAATTQLTCAAAGATSPDPSAPASSPVSSP